MDITERKHAEQALRESERRERDAAERLRALDEMKNTFLAAVSHELRSPPTSILGLSITLERSPAMDASDRDDLLERLACVQDDGPGVPAELRDAVFEPFRQGPTATPHSPGTGIGLSLVARFAELHGGRAWVDDRPGGGAAFRVSLPSPPGTGLAAARAADDDTASGNTEAATADAV